MIATGSKSAAALREAVALAATAAQRVKAAFTELMKPGTANPHPNSRRLVQSRAGVDTPEAAESRRAARAFTARAEAGDSADTSEYLRKKIEELRGL